MSNNTILQTILNRKTTLSFSNLEVPQEAIMQLLQAGMAAPTACDSRPWSFIVITKKETISKMAKILRSGKHAAEAPVLIIVCGMTKHFLAGSAADCWIQDCAAATQNILLAAEGCSLDSAWIGLHPAIDQQSAVNGLLGIPNDVIPFSVVCLGSSAENEKKPKDKFDISRIHRELW